MILGVLFGKPFKFKITVVSQSDGKLVTSYIDRDAIGSSGDESEASVSMVT